MKSASDRERGGGDRRTRPEGKGILLRLKGRIDILIVNPQCLNRRIAGEHTLHPGKELTAQVNTRAIQL